jgi:hypothetical protein
MKPFNRSVRKDFIKQAQVNSELAGIVPWKLKQFPHPMDYYARHNRDYFDTSKLSGYVWKMRRATCPGLEQFVVSFKRYNAKYCQHRQTQTSSKTESASV